MLTANTYQEIYEILSCMDKSTVMKIPQNILNKIIAERNSSYKTKINKYDLFNEENASKEAIDVICWLEYKYFISAEKKQEVDKALHEMYIEDEKKKSEKYSTEIVFKTSKVNQTEECTDMIMPKRKNKIIIVLEKIKNFFHIN